MTNYPSYEGLIESLGYEFEFDAFGNYQGDYAFVLKDGERRGVLIQGYGSCSGCDDLESIVGYGDRRPWQQREEVLAFRDEMGQAVQWFDNAEAAKAWVNHEEANRWWFYENGVREWLNETLSA